MILRAPDEPSSDTASDGLGRSCREKICRARGPCLARDRRARTLRARNALAHHARACSSRRGPLPPFARAPRSEGAFHRIGPALRMRARAFPDGRGPRFLRSGFALDRLSPSTDLLRSAQQSPMTLLFSSALLELSFEELFVPSAWRSSTRKSSASKARSFERSLAGSPLFLRSHHPPSSGHLPAGVIEARPRARLAWVRGRRRPRYVPTDVYNPRDFLSTTCTSRLGPLQAAVSHRGLGAIGLTPIARWGVPSIRVQSSLPHACREGVTPGVFSPCRAADVRCELRARVARSVERRPGAPRERSLRSLERSRRLPPLLASRRRPTNRPTSGAPRAAS